MEEHRSQRSGARLNGEHHGSQACSDAEIITAKSLQIPCTALKGSLGAGMYLLGNDRIGIEDYQLQFSVLTIRSRAQNWWQGYFQKGRNFATFDHGRTILSNIYPSRSNKYSHDTEMEPRLCPHVESFNTSIPAPTLSSHSYAQPFHPTGRFIYQTNRFKRLHQCPVLPNPKAFVQKSLPITCILSQTNPLGQSSIFKHYKLNGCTCPQSRSESSMQFQQYKMPGIFACFIRVMRLMLVLC